VLGVGAGVDVSPSHPRYRHRCRQSPKQEAVTLDVLQLAHADQRPDTQVPVLVLVLVLVLSRR
jgi:hypothetical protein